MIGDWRVEIGSFHRLWSPILLKKVIEYPSELCYHNYTCITYSLEVKL